MPHADLAHTELSQITFRAIDLIQRLQSYRRAMRNTRRQTSERRFVPCRQSHFARQLADLNLIQGGINKWRDHAMFDRSGAAGPSIGQIILIQSIEHVLDLLLLRERLNSRIHLYLAEVTTVRRVREIVLVLRFERPQYNVPRADLLREFLAFLQLSGR